MTVHKAEPTGLRGRLIHHFRKESFPPKWLLVVAIVAVIAGLSMANYRITAAESNLNQQAVEAAQFAQTVDQACADNRPVFRDTVNICDVAKDKADEPAPAADGLDALRGERGERGFTGLQGLPGQSGDTGNTGDKGDKGDLGPVAPALEPVPGVDGQPGLKGVDGQPGAPGGQGVPGGPGPAPTKITFSNGTVCTPTAEGSTEYTCDGPPPGGEAPAQETKPPLP